MLNQRNHEWFIQFFQIRPGLSIASVDYDDTEELTQNRILDSNANMKVGIFKDEQSLELFTTMCEERDKRLPSYTLETLLVSSFARLAIPFLDPTEFARNPSEQHLGRIFLLFFF